MRDQTLLEAGYDVAKFIARQKYMELRGGELQAILDQCTDPAGTFAKRHNKWLENSISISENWKGMVKLPENQISSGAFVDAHRSSPEMAKMLKESAEAGVEVEAEIDQGDDVSDGQSIEQVISENLYAEYERNQEHFRFILEETHHRKAAKTQLWLWVSNDIERFRAELRRDIAKNGGDPGRETMLGFFEEWSAWNDMIIGNGCKLFRTARHPECYLIFSTLQFAIKDMEHRLSIIGEAHLYGEDGDRAAADQAYRTYPNPEDPAASDIVFAQEIARHLTLP
ncbi:uncharacterized protein EAF01_006694 [Botrytis porri]|uniref:Uncharacterized protein n=1 Tax=Botrytis porri TaxID=87229 RepID=A0A4Z1KC19_9HELO|nr:uncharacterized protein EAF01_006694 [Botrytis porri]KAF7903645.1 hypothetical protein EAF01_006694 [Botrytis porri]TGO82926.1 hypothetical protein BPOR_0731g00010 [Botrytis porri]